MRFSFAGDTKKKRKLTRTRFSVRCCEHLNLVGAETSQGFAIELPYPHYSRGDIAPRRASTDLLAYGEAFIIMANAKTVTTDVNQVAQHDGSRRKSDQEWSAGNDSRFGARLMLDFGRGGTSVGHTDDDMMAVR